MVWHSSHSSSSRSSNIERKAELSLLQVFLSGKELARPPHVGQQERIWKRAAPGRRASAQRLALGGIDFGLSIPRGGHTGYGKMSPGLYEASAQATQTSGSVPQLTTA